MRITRAVLIAAALSGDCLAAQAQDAPAAATRAPMTMVWAPKPAASPFVAPNRPHWKLSEILAAHAGQKDWSEPIVRDPSGLSATYIQMAPGGKTKTMLFADSSIFWVVESGQIRFIIQGQEPFVASHNFIVSVPARTPFSMETVGDVPSLRFEVSHTRSTPLYPVSETPTPVKGRTYLRAAIIGAPAAYGPGVKPYVDFDKDIMAGGGRAPPGFAHDSETAANIIRGPGVPRPPDSDPGHFHDGSAEFFFVLDGHLSLLTEGVPFIAAAEPGDVLYAPAGRWHRTAFVGDGMSGRISIHGIASSLNILDPEHSAAAQ
ncbi:MAG TPA: cupin domain-containing protein [Rhizomicrobium sp.]|nr:cupin domain-containing protein [Rhizomicrobium sp.]